MEADLAAQADAHEVRLTAMFGRRQATPAEQNPVVALDEHRPEPKPAAAPAASAAAGGNDRLDELFEQFRSFVISTVDPATAGNVSRKELSRRIAEIVTEALERESLEVDPLEQRELISRLVEAVLEEVRAAGGNGGKPSGQDTVKASASNVATAKRNVQPILMERIDATAAAKLPSDELRSQIGEIVAEILLEQKTQLNQVEQRDLVSMLVNDMTGLGPLEPVLADDAVTDIMVNGPHQVYVERGGKLELTDVSFRDDAHVMNICTRIVSRIGRRVDESSPLVDARLEDGSRVNIIIPPLALDGPSISIRKFSKKDITLDIMARQNNISEAMATVLRIASRAKLNILISGGTGSGKTTLLNAMSQMIDQGERIVTIEDAAELQLQQPHVVRLETRPANLEGSGEITMRDLVKNSLRMRPDRIILGEVRGSEAVDMLQAMNTGHEGSLGTIHANRPREALTRLENMVGMAGINLPARAVRTQIASALDMILQVSRMRDGQRRITSITEVVGMEGDVVTTQELFKYQFEGEDADGKLKGQFVSSGLRPAFAEKAAYFGLDRALLEAM